MTENKLFNTVCEKIAKDGEYSTITKGVSMYPMLRNGVDIVVVKAAESLKKNDVILYKRDTSKSLVLHRIITVDGDRLGTRGDNTYYIETVRRSDVAGVLSGFYRKGKYHDTKKDKGYKIYVFFMRLFYPFRFLYFALKTKLKITKNR